MQIDGQDGVVISRAKVEAMLQVRDPDGGEIERFFISEDKGGNVRVSALIEVPAHLRRQAISLTAVKP